MRRRLSPAQAERRQRIVSRATALLAAGDPSSMEAVANAAKVSRATLYRYYTSREHLLAEVTLSAGQTLIENFRAHPPAGKTVGKRVEGLCHQLVRTAGENELLLGACVANLSSDDPAVLDTYKAIEHLVSDMLSSVMGQLKPAKRESQIRTTLFRYLVGGFALATTGKIGYDELGEDLVGLCRVLLGGDWDRKIQEK